MVEEGLEEMIIALVDKGHFEPLTPEGVGGGGGETAAENENTFSHGTRPLVHGQAGCCARPARRGGWPRGPIGYRCGRG